MSLKQEKFIQEFTETGNTTQSAIKAGYSEKSASVTGNRLKNNKAVISVMRDIAQELKDNAHVAYQVLQDIMLDNQVSAKVRSDVASNLLDRAGFKATEKREVTGTTSGSISSTVTFDLVQRARFMMTQKAEIIDA